MIKEVIGRWSSPSYLAAKGVCDLRGGVLGRCLGNEGRAFMYGLSALIKEPTAIPVLSTM